MWHCRFGHLGLTGIQTLLDKGLVTGLLVDKQSPKYDCEACAKAKQYRTPYPTETQNKPIKPGELIHMDL